MFFNYYNIVKKICKVIGEFQNLFENGYSSKLQVAALIAKLVKVTNV